MSNIGPELPPHLLAKRKRQAEDATPLPTTTAVSSSRHEVLDNESESDKRRRVIGPALPPATIETKPTNRAEESDSSGEDDFGPSLADTERQESTGPYDTDTQHDTAQRPVIQQTAKRDEWMTMAPAQDELAARMDPSRVRARGFNTRGGGSVAGRASDASAWHETAEQKQRRLADEVMGIKKDKPATASGSHASSKSGLIQATAGKAAMPKDRGPSLLEQHREREPTQIEDNPSKRAFDYEKDMGIGISTVEKREMLSKATDYSSRFSGGSYL